MVSLKPTYRVFPERTAGALKFPVRPRQASRIFSLLSSEGENSRIFFPFPTRIFSADRIRSQAFSREMASFLASAFSRMIHFFCPNTFWAFSQDFQPFLKYAHSMLFMVSPPLDLYGRNQWAQIIRLQWVWEIGSGKMILSHNVAQNMNSMIYLKDAKTEGRK